MGRFKLSIDSFILVKLTQVYVLLLTVLGLYFFNLNFLIISLVAGWALTGISVEVLIHRKYAHNQFEYKNIFFEILSYLILLSTAIGRPINWARGHRVHHRFTDQKEDPQSPHTIGHLNVFLSAFPSKVNVPKSVVFNFSDLTKNKRSIFFNENYYKLYLIYNIFWFLIDPILALYVIGIPSLMAWISLGTINVACHLTPNDPKDIPFPIWFWGANYHGTHHKDPTNLCLGRLDLSYQMIKIIGKPNQFH